MTHFKADSPMAGAIFDTWECSRDLYWFLYNLFASQPKCACPEFYWSMAVCRGIPQEVKCMRTGDEIAVFLERVIPIPGCYDLMSLFGYLEHSTFSDFLESRQKNCFFKGPPEVRQAYVDYQHRYVFYPKNIVPSALLRSGFQRIGTGLRNLA